MTALTAIVIIIAALTIGQCLCYLGANIGEGIRDGLTEIAKAMKDKKE